MRRLKNIKKAPFEIGSLLVKNEYFCALLYDDGEFPSEYKTTFQQMLDDKYITIHPPVSSGQITDRTRNTYCVILINNIDLEATENNIKITGNIYVISDINHILIHDNQNRLLEMVGEVYSTLNGAKISSAGEININSASLVIIDNFSVGYCINFSFVDQQNRKAEI